jgi:predicted nucleotidyltransferase
MLQTITPTFSSSLTDIGSVLAAHPAVNLAYLFGSAASGHMTPLSDVDIALITAPRLSPHDRLKLELAVADALAQHCGLANADVRVINEAPVMLRGQVVTEGRLLFARDEVARVEFETRTRSEYFDFLPSAEQLREAFFAAVLQRGLHG